MDSRAREVAENGDNILYIDGKILSRVVKLCFWWYLTPGNSPLGQSASRSLPSLFESTVLPFIETVGQHSIFHDGCPMYRSFRFRALVEQNGLAQFTVPSAFGSQPIRLIWNLAQQHLNNSQPATTDQIQEQMAILRAGLSQDSTNMYIDDFVNTNELIRAHILLLSTCTMQVCNL